MKIYPKTNSFLEGIENLKPYIEKYKGIEIQMLKWDELDYVYTVINNLKTIIPEIEEITIHPPIREDYYIEALTYRNYALETKRLQKLIEISEKYNIKINMLYHTLWNYIMWKNSGIIEELRNLVNILQNTKVNIIIENGVSLADQKKCVELQIVKEFNNKHLQLCIDICHLHCEANIFKMEFESFLNKYLNKEDCEKYVYQIHFAATLENDGYINKKTHGRGHINVEDLKKEYEILERLGIEKRIIVTEVSEDDYTTRVDQIEEIKMLESLK